MRRCDYRYKTHSLRVHRRFVSISTLYFLGSLIVIFSPKQLSIEFRHCWTVIGVNSMHFATAQKYSDHHLECERTSYYVRPITFFDIDWDFKNTCKLTWFEPIWQFEFGLRRSLNFGAESSFRTAFCQSCRFSAFQLCVT